MPIGDGSAQGARHLGIDFRRIRNREQDVTIAEPLRSRVIEHGIDAILYTDYPECEGRTRFPFHSKARALARDVVLPERLAQFDLSRPLASALRFDVPANARARIEERIRTIAGTRERLCVISPGGHTNVEKTWPQADVDAFVALLERRDASARAFVVNERNVAERFGDLSLPFAHVLVTLLRAAHAFVGVPSGPLHAAIVLGASPVVGIWLSRYPDWYDEPRPNVAHVVGPIPYKKRYDQRIGSTSLPPTLRHNIISFRERTPTPDDVLLALENVGRKE
jgi:ADP-heptose:LPS heptosyltransferase